MYTLGVDIGSTTSKAVVLRDGQEIVGSSIIIATVGTRDVDSAERTALEKAGIDPSQIEETTVTGYGRNTYKDAGLQVSELTCHALGVHHFFPDAGTVVDIGGQDAKVLVLNKLGRMESFIMNDKCAAGTGRFLDVMANILNLDITQLEVEAAKAQNPVSISSTCTVFAESEVISQLANGVALPDLVAGICKSVATRTGSLVKRAGVRERVCMSGGVAQNAGVRKALEEELGVRIAYSEQAQLMGALGAAIYAFNKAQKKKGV